MRMMVSVGTEVGSAFFIIRAFAAASLSASCCFRILSTIKI